MSVKFRIWVKGLLILGIEWISILAVIFLLEITLGQQFVQQGIGNNCIALEFL